MTTGRSRVATHQVRRLEIAVDLPFEEFRDRYEKAVPPFEPGHFFGDDGPGRTDWATITRITEQQAPHRNLGEAGTSDRSSRPRTSPGRTPTRTERRVIKVRLARRWGPARIGYLLGLNPSTVHRILTRYRLPRLAHLDRATAIPVRRYEHPAPGDLVHVDIEKLSNIRRPTTQVRHQALDDRQDRHQIAPAQG